MLNAAPCGRQKNGYVPGVSNTTTCSAFSGVVPSTGRSNSEPASRSVGWPLVAVWKPVTHLNMTLCPASTRDVSICVAVLPSALKRKLEVRNVSAGVAAAGDAPCAGCAEYQAAISCRIVSSLAPQISRARESGVGAGLPAVEASNRASATRATTRGLSTRSPAGA